MTRIKPELNPRYPRNPRSNAFVHDLRVFGKFAVERFTADPGKPVELISVSSVLSVVKFFCVSAAAQPRDPII
jgi:hypothetical protein